jgi:LmbE family N-acetylglucosaminyl deacetylase
MPTNPTDQPSRPVTSAPAATLDPASLTGATVLTVWAHPDDETYLSGGLMAAVGAAGGRVVNVTATLGEHGTPDPAAFPPERLARIRARELSAALATLGVADAVVLDFEDGTLDAVDPTVGTRSIMQLLERFEPDVVISFGPDGMTGHPDHVAVGSWTERAVSAWPGDPALLQATSAGVMPYDLTEVMIDLGAFYGDPPSREPDELDLPLELDAATLATKLKALAAHRSQTDLVRAALGETDYRRLVAIEAFRAANARARDRFTSRPATNAA